MRQISKFLLFFALLFQISLANLNFEIFYEQNATNEQIDAKLDEILAFFEREPTKINEKFGDFNESALLPFFGNIKIARTGKFDVRRIKKLLEFKPDLNRNLYDINGTTPLEITLFYAQTQVVNHDEIFNLAKILLDENIDFKKPELLFAGYIFGDLEIFEILLKKGAQNTNRLLSSLVFDVFRFVSQNGFSINIKKPLSPEAYEFIRSKKFIKFQDDKMKFIKKAFEFRSINDFNSAELDLFLKINSYVDNFVAVKFLLDHGLKNNQKAYESLKKYAKEFKSAHILKLLQP